MKNKTSIGDTIVHQGMPENGNPYRGESLFGEPRKAALIAFKHGKSSPDLTFWHAPSQGGAYRITSPDQIAYEFSSLKDL